MVSVRSSFIGSGKGQSMVLKMGTRFTNLQVWQKCHSSTIKKQQLIRFIILSLIALGLLEKFKKSSHVIGVIELRFDM